MANMAARTLARIPPVAEYNFYGGFATVDKNDMKGEDFSGPNWFTDNMKNLY